MTPKSKIVVFDLDDTLYKEVDFLKSAYAEIASTIIGKIPTLGLPLATEGTQEICGLSSDSLCNQMLSWWRDGENVFQRLIETYNLDLTVDQLLSMYRSHIPQISLDEETKDLLQRLSETAVLGIITDGRSVTQHNKIAALGLDAFMNEEDILVSGDKNHRLEGLSGEKQEINHRFLRPFGSKRQAERHRLHRLERLEGLNGEDSWEKPSELPFKYFMQRYPVNCKQYTVNYYYVADNPSKDFVAPNRLGWTTICLLDDGRNIHHQDFSLPQPMLPQHTISQITEIENII